MHEKLDLSPTLGQDSGCARIDTHESQCGARLFVVTNISGFLVLMGDANVTGLGARRSAAARPEARRPERVIRVNE
jgi:hypothetical protein